MASTFFTVLVIVLAVGVVMLLVTLAAFVVRDTIRRKGRWGINLSPTPCMHCGAWAPVVRTPANTQQALWGGWTCPQCGLELDKWGVPTAEQPFPAKWSAQLDDRPRPAASPDDRYQNPARDIQRGDPHA
jgi:hypothetical protein